jgi:hypothetical protein
MGCNDGNHAASTQDEPACAGLKNGVFGFPLNVEPVSKDDGLLIDPTAHHPLLHFQSFYQGWAAFTIMPVDDLKEVRWEKGSGKEIEMDVKTVEMKQVAPKRSGRFKADQVVWEAESFIFFESQETSLSVLDGIENAIDAGFETGRDKSKGSFCDRFQTFHNGVRILVEMGEQYFATGEVFGLGQRAENGLQERSFGGQMGADTSQTS